MKPLQRPLDQLKHGDLSKLRSLCFHRYWTPLWSSQQTSPTPQLRPGLGQNVFSFSNKRPVNEIFCLFLSQCTVEVCHCNKREAEDKTPVASAWTLEHTEREAIKSRAIICRHHLDDTCDEVISSCRSGLPISGVGACENMFLFNSNPIQIKLEGHSKPHTSPSGPTVHQHSSMIWKSADTTNRYTVCLDIRISRYFLLLLKALKQSENKI